MVCSQNFGGFLFLLAKENLYLFWEALMQDVVRGVGLGGLATLILACATASPAVASETVPHVVVPSQSVHLTRPNPPAGGGIKTVKSTTGVKTLPKPNGTPGIK
jgi:hypothetical protein